MNTAGHADDQRPRAAAAQPAPVAATPPTARGSSDRHSATVGLSSAALGALLALVGAWAFGGAAAADPTAVAGSEAVTPIASEAVTASGPAFHAVRMCDADGSQGDSTDDAVATVDVDVDTGHTGADAGTGDNDADDGGTGSGGGNGDGSGSGNGNGSGGGNGSGNGNGSGSGSGSGNGSGNDDDNGSGDGNGDGSGNDNGSGDGNGDGSGNDNGDGSGDDGSGDDGSDHQHQPLIQADVDASVDGLLGKKHRDLLDVEADALVGGLLGADADVEVGNGDDTKDALIDIDLDALVAPKPHSSPLVDLDLTTVLGGDK